MMKKGFTLVEILISIVIFTIAILMSAGSVVLSSSMRQRVEAMRQIQDEARFISEYITREVGSAKVASLPNCPNSTINICDTLIIERKDNTGNIIQETISPSVDGKSIEMAVSGLVDAQKITSDRIQLRKLRFINLTPGDPKNIALQVDLVAQEAVGNGRSLEINNKISSLGRPMKIELRFIATNIPNITEV